MNKNVAGLDDRANKIQLNMVTLETRLKELIEQKATELKEVDDSLEVRVTKAEEEIELLKLRPVGSGEAAQVVQKVEIDYSKFC